MRPSEKKHLYVRRRVIGSSGASLHSVAEITLNNATEPYESDDGHSDVDTLVYWTRGYWLSC